MRCRGAGKVAGAKNVCEWLSNLADHGRCPGLLIAFDEIEIESKSGNVYLAMASLAIVDGSTKGDIEIEADLIDIAMAEIAAPADIDLDGNVTRTPAFLGVGTRPC